MSLGKKLLFSFGAVIALIVFLSLSSFSAIGSLGGMLDTAATVTARKIALAADADADFSILKDRARRSELSNVIRSMKGADAVQIATCNGCHSDDSLHDNLREFDTGRTRLQTEIAAIRSLTGDGPDKAALDQVDRDLEKWAASYREYLSMGAAGDYERAHAIFREKMFPIWADIGKSIQSVVEGQRRFLADSSEFSRASARRHMRTIILLIAIGTVVTTIALLMTRQTISALRWMSGDLDRKAGRLASAAAQVSASGNALAQGASDQARSLQDVSGSSSEIRATASRNTENARKSEKVSEEVAASVGDARRRLEELMAAMRDIQDASAKVSRILKVIDEIAFQTNLLALNAAVEAARVGESGLGFAVVADEVRSLARRSAAAAQETAELIETSIQASENGMTRMEGVAQAFHRLSASSQTVTELAAAVQSGSLEQAQRVEDISSQIGRMQQVTEQATASALQSAHAGEELQGQAAGMREIAQHLLGIVGASAGPKAGHSR